jgi:hypothetical protein
MLGSAQTQIYNDDMTTFRPYTPFSKDPNDYTASYSPLQQNAQQGAANLQTPSQFGAATNLTGQAAGQSSMYGNLGAQAGQRAADLSSMYGNLGSQAGQQAAGLSSLYGNLGAQSGQGYAGLSGGAGERGAGIGQSLGQMSTDPNAVQSYMNPYLQASLNPQLAEIQRQYDVTGTQQQGSATKSGAFGGSREALMAAENQRNAGLAKNQVIGQGYNTAFQNAQQQMNAANQAALAGNQQALAGYGQAGQQALAGYGMGLQGAGQAGQQAMQGYGMGLQGAGQAGNQAMQGYGMGLTGAGQAGQMAGQMANIGQQQLAAQQGIISTQNQMGAGMQAQEQQKINQQIQDYATQQQYPFMQLGIMNSLLRGLPMQNTTTQSYQAQPAIGQQALGLGLGALGASKAFV